MARKLKFSLIIPTYSGEDHIDSVFRSILDQDKNFEYEVIVVIDGPKRKLKELVEVQKKVFDKKDIPFIIHQFKKNKGRFEARLAGAQLANSDRLLFADDRNILEKNYFRNIIDTNYDITIPNVIQSESNTLISKTLYVLRKSIYKKWGEDFTSYYINKNNFESSAKGTTGLWIKKSIFIKGCKAISDDSKTSGKYVNEDTRLFKAFLDDGHEIYRMSEAKIYYQSRTEFKDEVKHLYDRGPRFVNYYKKPGTKFFIPLTIMLLAPVVFVALALLNIKIAAILVVLCVILLAGLSLYVGNGIKNAATCFIGLILIGLIFSLGVYKGSYLILSDRIANKH